MANSCARAFACPAIAWLMRWVKRSNPALETAASNSRFSAKCLLRPILLTAAAAILGMIPIAPTVFWGPMAYAVIGGLMVATLLTLVFLPALYAAWFRIQPAQTMSADTSSDQALESELGRALAA